MTFQQKNVFKDAFKETKDIFHILKIFGEFLRFSASFQDIPRILQIFSKILNFFFFGSNKIFDSCYPLIAAEYYTKSLVFLPLKGIEIELDVIRAKAHLTIVMHCYEIFPFSFPYTHVSISVKNTRLLVTEIVICELQFDKCANIAFIIPQTMMPMAPVKRTVDMSEWK